MKYSKFESRKLIKDGIQVQFSKITNYSFIVIWYPSEACFHSELSDMLFHLGSERVKLYDDEIVVIKTSDAIEHKQVLKTLKSSRTQNDLFIDVYNGQAWRSSTLKCKGQDKQSVINSYKWKPGQD